ncbi:hypothetical protein Tco_0556744 [Tanacetum coccineum]
MAYLEFCETHNMVAYLKKIEGSEGFHQIVDFINSSHIRYALIENPSIYVSLIQQFWNTTTVRTLDNGEMEITATIDGKVKNVSKASIRRHLKLEDSDGISNLPTTEIFEQLALMGSKKTSWEQFSSYIATAIICLATNRTFNFFKMIFDGMGPVVQGEESTHPVESHHTPTSASLTSQPLISSPSRRTTRQKFVVPQPRSPTQANVADEVASTGVDVKHGGAATTVTSLDAGQGSGNIDKTPSMPHDSPLLRVYTLGSDEEVQGRHEHDFEFTTAEEVYTAKKGVSTVEPVSTTGASVSTASASSAKDKEALRLQAEIDEEERQRIVRRLQSEEREMYSEAKKARLLAELINERKRYFAAQKGEERRNKPLTQAQQRTYMSQYIKNIGSHTLKQLKSYSFDEIKNLFEITMRRVHTFVPMESESERVIPELAAGSSKRDAEEELVQKSSKRLKTKERLVPAEEPKDKEKEELSQERIQQMMIIVPEQGMNVYQFFDDMLKAFDREDFVKLWSLVKEKFTSTKPTEDKEREIWVELKRLFESNTDDELWKLQKHIHDNLTWKLYDSCCNTPKMGRSGNMGWRVLLHRSIAQDMRTTSI